jgi:hypothetical protein
MHSWIHFAVQESRDRWRQSHDLLHSHVVLTSSSASSKGRRLPTPLSRTYIYVILPRQSRAYDPLTDYFQLSMKTSSSAKMLPSNTLSLKPSKVRQDDHSGSCSDKPPPAFPSEALSSYCSSGRPFKTLALGRSRATTGNTHLLSILVIPLGPPGRNER